MIYEYERLISAQVAKRVRSAALVGLSVDEMMAVGRLASVEAVDSWDPDGGRSLDSWVWLNVQWDLSESMRQAVRQFTEELHSEHQDEEYDLDTVITIRQAMDILKAELPDPQWSILWLHHAEGRSCRDISADLGISQPATWQQLSRLRRKAVRILRANSIAI